MSWCHAVRISHMCRNDAVQHAALVTPSPEFVRCVERREKRNKENRGSDGAPPAVCSAHPCKILYPVQA